MTETTKKSPGRPVRELSDADYDALVRLADLDNEAAEQAAKARAALAFRLSVAKEAGYSVRTLALALDRTDKQVRGLLAEAE